MIDNPQTPLHARDGKRRIRIAVFASGNGSNAENIIRHFRGTDRGAEVVMVLSNRSDACVLQRADALGVESVVVGKAGFNDPAVMLPLLDNRGVDMIVLAGFLLMVPGFILDRFPERILNIHPSLLPAFGGKGMYGRHVHEAVVAAGVRQTGITVHYVTPLCDDGGIVFQAAVAVDPGDTPDDVEAKIHELERIHFPAVIERIASAIARR